MPLASIGFASTIAPRVDLYITLVCRAHPPGNTSDSESLFFGEVPTHAQCSQDATVQAAVAQLSAVLTMTMGILSCITGAWWGSLSDRIGRTPILSWSMFGLLINDIVYIITALFSDHLPGGYWFLIIGSILEGFLGALPAGVGALHGYIADCTDPSARSRAFSLNLGLMFSGMALGPLIGGILISTTGQTLSVFYLAAAVHAAYIVFINAIVPESLTPARRVAARAAHRSAALKKAAAAKIQVRSVRLLSVLAGILGFLTPLAVLGPITVSDKQGRAKRNWSLLYLAVSYGLTVSIIASMPFKFQYASKTFGWTSETLSYFVSLTGLVRAALLTAVLPVVIKFLKPKPVPIQLENASMDALNSIPSQSSQRSPSSNSKPQAHVAQFDLSLSRVSLAIEIIGFTVMAFAGNATVFTVGTLIGSCGSGFSPAVQAAALEVYSRQHPAGRAESGRLFGALSVVQAVGAQILGPMVYGIVFSKTVATLPRTILVLSVGVVVGALIFLAFVRLPNESESRDAEEAPLLGETGDVPTIVVTEEGVTAVAGTSSW
ncbi:MFS general substrate transporter [Coniophora puteana RWD-64-598 SS2]|uniref:MFS general substrate transporter n=1 Tax=Coniophora puteana (strain RWD-64-598) TaxID=741705 RepID=A0A5M3N253_CONPW|nr:MFS general substrate transporter [Coniophora puteana RWD-64-598 SS2]EIW85094.1 MFS general substrate transporter [Coniophora puteana RWD-64-598 SS2]